MSGSSLLYDFTGGSISLASNNVDIERNMICEDNRNETGEIPFVNNENVEGHGQDNADESNKMMFESENIVTEEHRQSGDNADESNKMMFENNIVTEERRQFGDRRHGDRRKENKEITFEDRRIEERRKGERRKTSKFITVPLPEHKTIALVAHDGKKGELIKWCNKNKEILKDHFLCGTGTTASMIQEETGLPVFAYASGPLGGDQQIGAKIVNRRVDILIFFSDPLEAQPHDTDVKALMRLAQVYNIPMALNSSTADFLITSVLLNKAGYMREITASVDKRKA